MRIVTDIEVAKKMQGIAASAKDRNFEYNMSFRRTKQLLMQEKCYYTGAVMTDDNDNKPTQRSFDKIDPNKGYIDSNVVACTCYINCKKSNLTIEEIKLLYNKIKNR